ncbi:MAG: DNRLRE domain-containing protein [candidate division WOR-3 bacterium]
MQNRIKCQVIKDTWIYKGQPNKNYGDGGGWKDITDPYHPVTIPKLFLGFSGTDKEIVLLQFDITNLPKDKKPKRAIVKLYNDFSGSDAAIQVAAKQILSPWEEMAVTYKTAPKIASSPASIITLKGAHNYREPGRWYEWDVTQILEKWLSGEPNYGIALDPVGEYGVDHEIVCKENKDKADFAPVLEVEY